ncbi:Transcriptional regulator, LysR family [Candidatus Burkholderia verschuerenii]|uniref:Transcriptional regulator, LysR family n=1 Tax=Candidatus Burkholderia verschuerenii TaxID=242163 RepID=A0A0L0MIB7_9BURK|nr:LysR family transcriptional regulator [Candidatus Burkholderia verschuerenii]KND61714.1 Transcriptional regulator, LysR family [Candidatus Burkholderia verschuerenii]
MDRFQAIATFVTVVETGGFASAARKMEVSPSVVSRVVTELEEHLGVRLLTRTTRVVRLTDAGSGYFEDCRRILGEIGNAELSAAGTHSAPRGLLSLTAPTMFGRLHVTPVVLDYLRRYPEADVNCWFVDRVVNLVDEGIDVAVRIAQLPDSTLQAIPVGRVRRVLCASPAYLAEHGVPKHPDDLLDGHTIIANTGASAPAEWRLHDGDKQILVRTHPRLTTTTNDSAITAALAGFGIARLLSYQIAQYVSDGSLVSVLDDFAPPPVPIHLVHREGRHVTQKVRAFLDLAVAMLRAEQSLNGAPAFHDTR